MQVKHRLRTLLCCLVLETGALSGIPMRPEQIRNLMESLNVAKVAHTDPERNANGARSEPDAHID